MAILQRRDGSIIAQNDKKTVRDLAEANKAYLGVANLEGANLEGANLEGANLRGAYLGEANLRRANLENITVPWTSHALISEILYRAAGDNIERQKFSAWVGRKTEWCWGMWEEYDGPERKWAICTLRKWKKDGDDAPEILGDRL